MEMGLEANASTAVAAALARTGQSQALQQAWINVHPILVDPAFSEHRKRVTAEQLEFRRVVDLLLEFPESVDPSPTADLGIEPAARLDAAHAKEMVRRDFYGLALSPLEVWRADYRDRMFRERAILLIHGRYEVAPDGIEGHGQILNDIGPIASRGIGAEFAGSDVWALGRACLATNRQTLETTYWLVVDLVRLDQGTVPLPRWIGHTRAGCYARSLCMRALIADVDDASLALNPQWAPQELRVALAAIHCPTSAEEVATDELRDAVRTVLVEFDARSAASSRPLKAPAAGAVLTRAVTSWRDAELYAEEVLRSLGFADARHGSGGNDGGVDVRGRHLVCQVKFDAREVKRPEVQNLTGVAYVESACAIFFSRGRFTGGAIEWAERAGVACIQFDEHDGSLLAITQAARDLLSKGQHPPRLLPRTPPPIGPPPGFAEALRDAAIEVADDWAGA